MLFKRIGNSNGIRCDHREGVAGFLLVVRAGVDGDYAIVLVDGEGSAVLAVLEAVGDRPSVVGGSSGVDDGASGNVFINFRGFSGRELWRDLLKVADGQRHRAFGAVACSIGGDHREVVSVVEAGILGIFEIGAAVDGDSADRFVDGEGSAVLALLEGVSHRVGRGRCVEVAVGGCRGVNQRSRSNVFGDGCSGV